MLLPQPKTILSTSALPILLNTRGGNRTGQIINNWLRNRNTLEFLGIWEQLNNPNFNVLEFEYIKKEAGLNSFTITQKQWAETTEADLLNVALFGITAKAWNKANSMQKGNMRDHANVHQLVCLANLESMNAHYINEGLSQSERVLKLNTLAIYQMGVLLKTQAVRHLDLKR